MKPRDRKLAILRQLGQESEPITLSELLDKVHIDYTNRTVRRWLNELVNEGLVQKSGYTREQSISLSEYRLPSKDKLVVVLGQKA